MRRAPLLVISGAVAGFAGLIGWHSVAGTGPAVPQAAAGGPAGPSTPAAAAGSAGSGTRAGHPSGRGAGKHAAASGAVRTATGPVLNFGYGSIAVRVTVRGNSIIAASVSTLTTLEPTSQQISGQAIPLLHSEVLAVHSARINGVSGATYTSEGYYRSLEAALAQLHVR
jgi:uncharacterized protein with FMN-binding domain